MRVNPCEPLKDPKGGVIQADDHSPVTIKAAAVELLYNCRPQQITSDQLERQIGLARKLDTLEAIDVSIEEAALIRELALVNLRPVVAWALREALDQAAQAPTEAG